MYHEFIECQKMILSRRLLLQKKVLNRYDVQLLRYTWQNDKRWDFLCAENNLLKKLPVILCLCLTVS